MLQDNRPRSDRDLDHLLSAVLHQPSAPDVVKARGVARLSALAAADTRADRARRARRAAAVLAPVAVAASAVLVVTMTGGAAVHPAPVTLDAFTVTRHAQTVDVTIRDMESLWSARVRAALRHKLRADGIRAQIWNPGGVIYDATAKPPAGLHPRLWCHPSPLAAKVFTDVYRPGNGSSIAFKIRPGNIPPGARVLLIFGIGRFLRGYHAPRGVHPIAFALPGHLITASGRCLG